MTDSYTYNTEASEYSASATSTGKPEPKYFINAPVNYQITNNEYTSGPYYYDFERNSWIFYIPGTDIPAPPLDPDGGNLWIDPTNMYLMYVYNENEMTFAEAQPNRWYALTTNKRAYDYLILPTASNGDDITIPVPENRINIFKQSHLYFNKEDVDLKVRVERYDDDGDVIGWQWASITQRAIEAIENPKENFNNQLPASTLRNLHTSTNALQARVDALRKEVGLIE